MTGEESQGHGGSGWEQTGAGSVSKKTDFWWQARATGPSRKAAEMGGWTVAMPEDEWFALIGERRVQRRWMNETGLAGR